MVVAEILVLVVEIYFVVGILFGIAFGLAAAQGGMIHAELVEITGTVRVYGDLEVLHADPATYRRVSAGG